MEGIEKAIALLSAAETLATDPDLGPANETLPNLLGIVKRYLVELEKTASRTDNAPMKILPLETGPLTRPQVGGRPPASERLIPVAFKLPESRHAALALYCEGIAAKPSDVMRTLVCRLLDDANQTLPAEPPGADPGGASSGNAQKSA